MHVIRLDGVVGYPVRAPGSAPLAQMHDLPPLLGTIGKADGSHQTVTGTRPVTRAHVHMHGAQAYRTMVAIASVRQRCDRCSAIDTYESAVLVFPRHRRLPGLRSKGAGFRLLFGPKAIPGLIVAGTTSPPCPGDYFRFQLQERKGIARSIRTKTRFVQLDGPV
jgi:hypothetical protein